MGFQPSLPARSAQLRQDFGVKDSWSKLGSWNRNYMNWKVCVPKAGPHIQYYNILYWYHITLVLHTCVIWKPSQEKTSCWRYEWIQDCQRYDRYDWAWCNQCWWCSQLSQMHKGWSSWYLPWSIGCLQHFGGIRGLPWKQWARSTPLASTIVELLAATIHGIYGPRCYCAPINWNIAF